MYNQPEEILSNLPTILAHWRLHSCLLGYGYSPLVPYATLAQSTLYTTLIAQKTAIIILTWPCYPLWVRYITDKPQFSDHSCLPKSLIAVHSVRFQHLSIIHLSVFFTFFS